MSTHIASYQPAIAGKHPSPDEIRRLYEGGTIEECKAAGMRRWGNSGLLLIPGAWVDAVPDDLLVESITGHFSTVATLRAGDGAWDDARLNYLAHGWNPAKRDSK